MNKTTKSCLMLCKEFVNRKYPDWVQDVFRQYQAFFEEYQVIEDSIALDPTGEKGTFAKITKKIVDNFLSREKQDAENGYKRPIIIKSETSSKVMDALKILDEGIEEVLGGDMNIYYYAISLSIPWKAIPRWMSPVDYFVVDTKEDAKAIAMKKRRARPDEVRGASIPILQDEKEMVSKGKTLVT